MHRDLTTWLPILLLIVMGTLAGIGNVLQSGIGPDDGFPAQLDVTSRSDRGPGSLRAALFTAMKAPHPVTIRVIADVIDIEVPLPPVAANGLTLTGQAERPVLLRRASTNPSDSGLLTILADDVLVSHVAVDAAGGHAIRVQGDRVRVDTVSIANADIAIDGIDPREMTIQDSRFTDNDIAVRLGGKRATATIVGNDFRNSRQAGVWVALATDNPDSDSNIRVHDNRFSGGLNGIVAVNVRADLRGNRIGNAAQTGISIQDARANVVANQVLDGKGVGIHAARLHSSVVVDNEVARNEQIGILVVDANGLQVDRNQVYQNGYGIATVGLQPIDASVRQNTLAGQAIDGLIAIGESPLVDGNHSIENGKAGIRIMNLIRPGMPTITAQPRLANNTVSGNGDDDVQFGNYVVQSQ